MALAVDFGLELLQPANREALYPTLHRMRAEDPVHFSQALNAWFLTRYEDVQEGLRDPQLSSDRASFMARQQFRGLSPAVLADFERTANAMMAVKDGPEHHRLRALGNRGFSPAFLERALPVVRRGTDALIDRALEAGRFDLVTEIAHPLPFHTLLTLFGIPESDREMLWEWAAAYSRFFAGTLGNVEEVARAANAASAGLERYFLALLEERRRQPGEDLASLLLAGQAEGRLTAEEVCAQCILILVGTHVTTIDQVGNVAHALLSHPEQADRLRAEPALAPSACEELMRYDPSGAFVLRVAAADLTVGGKRIARGEAVFLSIAAANRDPAVFPEPDRLDLGRTPNRHLAFGQGPHICVGRGLARHVFEYVPRRLLTRMPNLRLDPDRPARRCLDTLGFRGFASLPVIA
jgi:cytochrome P450 PksS